MKRILLLLTMTLVACASPSAAQSVIPQATSTATVDDVRRDSRIHAGPLYLSPALLLKELGADTNVFNASGEAKSDFTFTVTPQTDIGVPIARRALIKATAGADFVYYAQYASERSIDPQGAFRGEFYVNHVTLFAEDAYINTRQRPNYEIDLRSRHLENNAVAGVQIRLAAKLYVEAGERRGVTKYDADAQLSGVYLQQTLNRNTTGEVGAVRYRMTPLTTIVTRFERLRDRFPYSPERDSRSDRVMPGVEFRPKALVSGFAYVGYRRFTPSHPAMLPEFTGAVADVGLSYTLLASTSFGVSYRRDLTYSWEVLQPFFVDNSVGVSIRRALGGRFDTIVSADRHEYQYENVLAAPDGTVLPPAGRVDLTWVYGANVGYRLHGDTRVGFGATYYQRDSNLVSFVQYDGLRFGTTVTYGF